METLTLLSLWQIDDDEDSFFDIDFTLPIKRNTKTTPKANNSEQVTISSLLESTNSSNDSSKYSSKYIVRKYMKLIKPLYSKVSKRKFPNDSVSVGDKKSPLREVCRQLRKSRSASSAVGIVQVAVSGRRDDSLLQQHDGIQSAIMHCRSSYYSSRSDSAKKSVDEVPRRVSI